MLMSLARDRSSFGNPNASGTNKCISMIIKFMSFQVARAWRARRKLRSRPGPHFGPLSRLGSGLFAAERHCEQTTLILRQTRCECILSPIIPGQIVFEHVLLRDQVWAPARCVPTPQNTRCNRTTSTGRIMVVGPAAEFGARVPIEDEGRDIVRSRQIYRTPWNVYCRAVHGLSPGSNISRSHSTTVPPCARFVFPLDTLIFWVRAGYLGGSELPHRIHRFIMLRIPSADNHVLRATRFAWNSRSFGLTREHYMHNTIPCILFAQS